MTASPVFHKKGGTESLLLKGRFPNSCLSPAGTFHKELHDCTEKNKWLIVCFIENKIDVCIDMYMYVKIRKFKV